MIRAAIVRGGEFGTGAYCCTALSWVFFLLAKHPSWQEKLRQEIKNSLGDGLPTFENIQSIPLAGMIVKEALRLFPPAPFVARQARQAVELNGYHIPADTVITIGSYAIHRNPKYWDDPLEFNPLRFDDPNWQKSPLQWVPFGGGPARCIGERLAVLEITTVLVILTQRLTWQLADRQSPDEPGYMAGTLGPKNGMWLKFTAL